MAGRSANSSTAAATAARVLKKSQAVAQEMVLRLPRLPDDWLMGLAAAVENEIRLRQRHPHMRVPDTK